MISFEAYRKLTQNQQAEILWIDGVYLDLIRETSMLNIELYALNDFYVEIYFDKATEDPLFLRTFKDPTRLEPYLPLIRIEESSDVNH